MLDGLRRLKKSQDVTTKWSLVEFMYFTVPNSNPESKLPLHIWIYYNTIFFLSILGYLSCEKDRNNLLTSDNAWKCLDCVYFAALNTNPKLLYRVRTLATTTTSLFLSNAYSSRIFRNIFTNHLTSYRDRVKKGFELENFCEILMRPSSLYFKFMFRSSKYMHSCHFNELSVFTDLFQSFSHLKWPEIVRKKYVKRNPDVIR